MYVFLHVPKAGGTYFKSLLHESAQSRIALPAGRIRAGIRKSCITGTLGLWWT